MKDNDFQFVVGKVSQENESFQKSFVLVGRFLNGRPPFYRVNHFSRCKGTTIFSITQYFAIFLTNNT